MQELLEQVLVKLASIEKNLMQTKEALNIDELAEYTGFSKSYIYQLTCKKSIPFYKPNGKGVFFSRAEIDQWLLSNRVMTTAEAQAEAIAYTIKKSIKR